MNEPERRGDLFFAGVMAAAATVVMIAASTAIGVSINRQTKIMEELTTVQLDSAAERRIHNQKLLDLLERIRAERGME